MTISGILEHCIWERVIGCVKGYGGLVSEHVWHFGALCEGPCCRMHLGGWRLVCGHNWHLGTQAMLLYLSEVLGSDSWTYLAFWNMSCGAILWDV